MSEAEKGAGARADGLGMDQVLKAMVELCRDPKTAPLAESIAGSLIAVLGSGPSVATLQSLIAANQASGAMFQNAVANQQMTNIVGMVATMNCVQALLDQPANIPYPDVTGGQADG